MGTNYYAIPKVTDDVKLKIIQAVINEQMSELTKLIPRKIHIGKSSSGWPFLFNHNEWEHYKTIGELKDFLDKCEITDEYNAVVPITELVEYIENKQKIGVSKFIEDKYSDHYIIRDGYAFSTSTEFS